jgi:hypothetical protein
MEISAEEMKKIEARIAAALKPGEYPDPDKQTSDLKQCGKCDGVIFLGAKENFGVLAGKPHVERLPSYERQAKRYLRPMSLEWHARELHYGRDQRGVCMPQVSFLYREKPLDGGDSIEEVAAKAGREICRIFTQEQHCIDAIQPEHRERWRVFPVEEGVWAVLYI